MEIKISECEGGLLLKGTGETIRAIEETFDGMVDEWWNIQGVYAEYIRESSEKVCGIQTRKNTIGLDS